MKENEIMKMLYDVKHPGKGDRNIVELGIVDKVEIDGDKVTLTLAFPKHRDPLTEYIVGSAKAAIYRQAPEVKEVIVNAIVREESAPKKQTGLNLSLDEVNNVRHIIGVASGKGGVGKSTVAVNLAVALARLGYKVGLADADVYGPSVPKMTATEGALPEAVKEDDKEIIMPIEKYGVKWMSIGYFAEPGQALIWRGPMASISHWSRTFLWRAPSLSLPLRMLHWLMSRRVWTCSATRISTAESSASWRICHGLLLPNFLKTNIISSERTEA